MIGEVLAMLESVLAVALTTLMEEIPHQWTLNFPSFGRDCNNLYIIFNYINMFLL